MPGRHCVLNLRLQQSGFVGSIDELRGEFVTQIRDHMGKGAVGKRFGGRDEAKPRNGLVVTGKKRDELNDGEMLHVGIANRGFERRFELADYVRVANADLADGLLVIDLVREVPDAMKPKKIAIGGQKTLEVVKNEDDSEAA